MQLIRRPGHGEADGRDMIEFFELPVTKGLRERIHHSGISKKRLGLKRILNYPDKAPARPGL
jgi:hypothetical protein